jgi:uncharacterized protein YbbK (DUF523 family)
MSDTALVSSCLLGLPTRYDGTDNHCQDVIDYLSEHQLIPIPVCPEQLAGLSTPRLKCWFIEGDGQNVLAGNGKICDENGEDLTAAFQQGAGQTLKIAQLTNSSLAILKQRSPSCGSCQVHQNGQLISGMGVTAARLKSAGLTIYSEENLPQK